MILLKDKKDITQEVKDILGDVEIIGAYESSKHIKKEEVKILSVKFSKVGKLTFEKYPNLQYIICRSHGIDNVNKKEAEKRNIKIIATSPDKMSCTDWLYNKIEDDSVVIFGNGPISKELQKKLNNSIVINSKTNYIDIDKALLSAKTIVIALPLTENTKDYFNHSFFDKIKNKVNIVSISRGECFNNKALLDNVDKINYAHMDMVSPYLRDELIETGKVKYYNHSAWKSYDKERYGIDYAENLKKIIDDCIIKESKWF